MSIGTVVAITAVLVLTIAVPLGIMLRLARTGGSWKDFFAGAAVFVAFAMVFEQAFHFLVLQTGAAALIQKSVWLGGLYGGLAAGLFEETGRFVAFRAVLQNRKARIASLAYGIGHGGVEAFLVTGLAMVSNLALGLQYARGGAVPAEIVPTVEVLLTTPATLFLWSGFERLTAMALHMALSVLVFAAVHAGRRWLYPAAILLHAGVDFAAVVSNAYLPVAATELLVLALTAAVLLWAARVYKSLSPTAQTP